jgi:hypothetical protein
VGAVENLANRRGEILHSGTGHNDRVPPAVGFFGDAEEFSAFVLPELHVKMLSLNLQFSRFDDVIHSANRGVYCARLPKWKKILSKITTAELPWRPLLLDFALKLNETVIGLYFWGHQPKRNQFGV